MIGSDRLPSIAVRLFLILVLSAAPLAAQGFDYSSFGIRIDVEPAEVPQGGSGTVIFTIVVPAGHSMTDTPATFGIVPGAVEGVSFGELEKPEPERVDDIGGHYVDTAVFRLPFDIAPTAATGERELTFGFRLQACDDFTGVCYFPTRPDDVGRVVSVTVVAASAAEIPEVEPERDAGPGAGLEETEREPSESSAVRPQGGESLAAAGGEDVLGDWFAGALRGGNLWLALLLAFVAGVLTSLTPCVYPMIPITISYVSGRAEGKRMNGFLISLVLVLGIAVTYSVLGVVAGATGALFGAITQHPAVQGLVFVVLVAIGLSMLGAFEIALPASWLQKLQVRRKGYLGALVVGLTIGFVAAPCVAPILVVMLTWISQSGDLLLGFVLMFVYALGMGVLFVLIGTFSNIILPRSGVWMEWLKKIFAFVLFLVAVFFAEGLLDSIWPSLFDVTLGALLVLFGAVLGAFHRLERDAGWWLLLGKTAGVLLVAAGLVVFALGFLGPLPPASLTETSPAGVQSGVPWVWGLDTGLRRAELQGLPVLIDYWADWCVACIELDHGTFSDARVATELGRFVPVKVDGSDVNDPGFLEAKQRFGVVGLPTVIILDAQGAEARRFTQFLDADTVLGYLREVR